MRTPLNFSKPPAITSLDKAGPRVVCPTRHWREGRRRERGRRRNRLIPPSPSRLLSPSPTTPTPAPPAQARGRRCRLVFGDGVERFHQDQELYRFRGVWCLSVERAGPGTLPIPLRIRFPSPVFWSFWVQFLVRLAQFCGIYCRLAKSVPWDSGGFSMVFSFQLIGTGISPEMRVCRNLSEKR